MSNMILEVKFNAGTSITEAVLEAKDKVRFLGLSGIKFSFNGVSITVGNHTWTEKEVEAIWNGILDTEQTFLFI